ncbi:MAG: 4Fe-4S dicluster domain-containing protein [Gammaproteobacteria bacterium]|nr:4Fe-4S dicluster domain-containing protein [Gammaproteobacteria bacterium]
MSLVNGRIRPRDPPPPEYAFGYLKPPRSGNEINGLGEREFRRATAVFHNAGNAQLEWQALDDFFGLINPWGVVRHVVANAWQLRKRNGPVAARRVEADPGEMSERVKAAAREFGADLVGIAPVTDEAVFAGRGAPHGTAICIGLSMNQDKMAHAPQDTAAVEVMRAYRQIARIALRLGRYVRRLGWPAKAYGNPNSTDILHIPLAVAAGLGQLGKHGSMISKEHGSNFRLAAVLTDLPLALDEPVDIAVDDLCTGCRRCVVDCPPDAIFNEKQWIRGGKRWYVDFDKCIPYFVKTHGCAICIEVCPWSRPGQGPKLVEKLMAKRRRASATASTRQAV